MRSSTLKCCSAQTSAQASVKFCTLIITCSLSACSWVMSDPLPYPEEKPPKMDMTIADPPKIIPEVIAGESSPPTGGAPVAGDVSGLAGDSAGDSAGDTAGDTVAGSSGASSTAGGQELGEGGASAAAGTEVGSTAGSNRVVGEGGVMAGNSTGGEGM